MLWLIPALAALAALLALVPWLFGIPGDPDAPYAQGWGLGLFALFGYLGAYAVAIVLWLVAHFFQLPVLATFTHGFIWVALVVAGVVQLWAWRLILATS